MLSALVPSLLPASVTELFVPPLDPHHLHVSLTAGQLQLSDLVLNPEKVNGRLLSALAPIHLLRGTIGGLSVQVDWMKLLSLPLRVEARGIHLVVGHNVLGDQAINKTPIVEPAGAKRTTAGGDLPTSTTKTTEPTSFESERKTNVDVSTGETPPSTPTAAGGVVEGESTPAATSVGSTGAASVQVLSTDEQALLDAAIDAKKLALELFAKQPNALNFAPPIGLDLSAITLNAATKKIISMLVSSLQVSAQDITIEYEHEPRQDVAEKTKADTSEESKVVTPSQESAQSVLSEMESLGLVAKVEQRARLGVGIKAMALDSYKSTAEQLGVSGG